MSFQSRGLLLALTLGLSVGFAAEARSAMTLDFGITPMVQPHSGSLSQDSNGTIVGTNLAVTSVTSVETGKVVNLTKFFDFQNAGSTGANFFILNGAVQQYSGTAPTAMTSPATSTKLTSLATGGYLFTMMIGNGYVSNDLASQFGAIGGYGWSGVLTLSIAKFDSTLGSDQVTSGDLVLTSPTPVPAGETIIAPAVVPEPSSLLMAGMGLIIVVGRFRNVTSRVKQRAPRRLA